MKKFLLSLLILLSLSGLAQSNNINTGLVAYFPLDNDVNDYSPLQIHGTNYNAVPQSDGLHNYYYFNGTNAYIYAGNDDRGIVDSLSVSVWVKTTATDIQWIVGHYNHLDEKGFHVYVNYGHAMMAGRDGYPNTYYSLIDDDFINDGEWHHIVALIAGNEWKLIVDCEIKGILITNAANPNYGIDSQPFSISKYPQLHNGYDPIHFTGGIDDIRVYNRQLSLCEICYLHQMFERGDTQAIKNENDLNVNETFKIYPNPGKNHFTIDLTEKPAEPVQMTIYDMQGKLITQKFLSKKLTTVNTSDFSKGIYIVNLQIEKDTYSKKLIIQ